MNDGAFGWVRSRWVFPAICAGALAIWTACSDVPTPFVVRGPGIADNIPPTLTFLVPTADRTVDQGSRFLIEWTDSDTDSDAQISFSLVNTDTTDRILLVQRIEENDTSGRDSVSIGTTPIPTGEYNLLGIIDDQVNAPVEVYAMTVGQTNPERVKLNITPPGTGPPTRPPTVAVIGPVFNQSVAEDDVLTIIVQPTEQPANVNNPYDADSDVRLYIILDINEDPTDDDPANAQVLGNEDTDNDVPAVIEDGIVLLRPVQLLPMGSVGPNTFDVIIDLQSMPPRNDGQPYFIRASIDDGTNPRVDRYASGKISVVALAAGLVDLSEIGKTQAGAIWYGFSPGANTGSSMAGIGDFDADGIDDFVLLAQFGNPRNFGMIGEGYLVYGLDRTRFGGSISVNSVSQSISGVIFEGPPIRRELSEFLIPSTIPPYTSGIGSVNVIRDLTGDGRPEIMFGLPHVHGAIETTDWDPGDETSADAEDEEVTLVFRQGGFVQGGRYQGVDDVTIDSSAPTAAAGSSPELNWRNDVAGGVQQFSLIKFRDVLDFLPADTILFLVDPGSIDAQLEFRVFDAGGPAMVHTLLTDFDEQTTFATFGDGGPPVAGVDYLAEGLGNVDGMEAATVMVDVSDAVRQLFDGQLQAQNNELRFILVADAAEGANGTAIRSSESGGELSRPSLTITYTQTDIFGALGCYPDLLANNLTDPDEVRRDTYSYAGGMALILNSQNRDTSSTTGININRLESTTVALELVGQAPGIVLDASDIVDRAQGGIFARADNEFAEPRGNEAAEPDRVSGVRFIGGGFDAVDHQFLRQGPREESFGQTVASLGDITQDGLDEILISAPRNERYLQDLQNNFGTASTQLQSSVFEGSILVLAGNNYNIPFWRDQGSDSGTSTIPSLNHQDDPSGSCSQGEGRGLRFPADFFEVFAENVDDMLGGAVNAGDFNQDGLDDILCGAYQNDRGPNRLNTGAVYILYGRNLLGDFQLNLANDPLRRPPMLRIRGVHPNDQIGWKQTSGLDVNGDRIDDVFLASPRTDPLMNVNVTRARCGEDFNDDDMVNGDDYTTQSFEACRTRFARPDQDLFSDDACKAFDYDNDDDIDDDDERVVTCLQDGGTDCCANLVDNGFVGVVFGGVLRDGDRDIEQIASSDLPGAIFYGYGERHRAGHDLSSAGDFNQDGFGDLLIVAPGESRFDTAGRERLGVVYVVFGGTHLTNTRWSLDQVGTVDLPGIVFLSPYVIGRPNEAAPLSAAFLGDVNRDGFGDIMIGNPNADFIDRSFPQGPDAPSGDAAIGRRRNAGDSYLIYGNNFGTNRTRR